MKLHVRRLALEVLAFLVVGSLLLVGVAIWRLSSGPIALTFLTSTIEETLNPPGADYRIEIGDTELTWAGWERVVDLVARDVRLRNADGAEIAELPRLAVGLSIEDIGRGAVRPTSVDLLDAEVVLLRRADGSLAFAINPPGIGPVAKDADGADESMARAPPPIAEAVDGALLPPQVVDELTRPPDGKGLIGGLTRINLRNARVWFDNRETGRVWRGESINARIDRDVERLDADISGALRLIDGQAELSGDLVHVYGSDLFELSLRLRDAPVAIAARFLPDLGEWLPRDETAAIDVGLTLDAKARPRSARLGWDSGLLALTAEADGMDVGAEVIEGRVTLERLEPARLAEAIPPLAALGALDAPVSGTGTFRLDRGRDGSGLEAVELSLSAGSGVVDLPALYPDGLVIYGADADLSVERGADGALAARLADLRVDLGGPTISATGGASLSPEAGFGAEFDLTLSDLPMQRLDGLWPESLAIDAREWVVPNIPHAEVDRATLGFALDLPAVTDTAALAALDPESLPLDAFRRFGGVIEFREAEVDYLNPLTRARGVDGRAEYDLERFDIDVVGGTVGDIALKTGRVEITGFQEVDQAIDIALDIDAPLGSALALLDTEPYRFVRDLGLDAGSIEGDATVEVGFAFPLIDELEGRDVVFDAAARLRDVVAPIPDLDIVARGEALDLWIDNSGLDVAGPVRVDGLETDLTWRESFDPDAPVVRHMRLEARPMAADLGRFGLDLVEVIDGEIPGRLDYRSERTGDKRLSLSADLSAAAVDLAALNWAKPPGRAAAFDLEAVFPATGDATIPFARFSSEGEEGGLIAEGSLRAPQDFAHLRSARLTRLAYGPHFISGALRRSEDGTYLVDLEGSSADLSGILGDDAEGEQPPHAEEAAEEQGPPVRLTARLDRVVDDEGRALEQVELALHHDGRDLRMLDLDGRIPDGGMLAVDLVPEAGGAQRLSVVSDDAGGALKTLDWTTRITGGALRIDGTRADPDAPIEGHLTVERFTLQEAPALAKILEFMTLTGIRSALTQSGLPFERLETDFNYLDGTLTLTDARAYGAALGLTTEGRVDLDRDYIDLSGTAAPMYSISQVIGAIPILGDILTAGGEGLFAANYAVEGPIDDPRVTVNPLSVLAPGFTRRLFGAPAARDPDASEPPALREQQGN